MSTPAHVLLSINASHAAARDVHLAREVARTDDDFLWKEVLKLATRVKHLEQWKRRRFGRRKGVSQ
jgi:hypothetical protein